MKRISVMSRRRSPMFWVAMLTGCLLLSGANTMNVAAAPAVPVTDQRAIDPAAAAAPDAPDDAVEPGLWGWWRFEEQGTAGDGTPTTPDESTYGHTAYFGDDGGDDCPDMVVGTYPPSYMTNNTSLHFDGGNDWLSMHTGPDIASDDNFTMAAWIKWTNGKSVIFFQGQTEDDHGLRLGIDLDWPTLHPNEGTLVCGFGGNDLRYDPNNDSLANTWRHVACVCDHDGGHARRIYVDGVLVASDNPTDWYVGGGHLWMGRKRPSTAPWDFGGYIDEPRMYTRALTATEIKALAARSDAGNSCFTQPVNSSGATDGTIYASTDWTAVQAAIDTLGANGGTVRISGTCTGVNLFPYAFTRSGLSYLAVDYQTALVPTLNTGGSLTLEGGWNNAFTTHDAATHPTTLDAGDAGRVVYAPGTTGSLTLQDLTITGGNSDTSLEKLVSDPTWTTVIGNGGALNTSMPTTLINVSVTDSHGGDSGGGISAAAALTMTGCTVSGNETGHADPSTGYWNAKGGGIAVWGALNMTDCIVTNNTATIADMAPRLTSTGGGIFAAGPYTLTDCEVTNNTAYQGGGLRHAATSGTISGSTFSGNSATDGAYTGTYDDGGAIYLANGTLSLTNDTNITGNSADGNGGGIFVSTGGLTVSGGKIGWHDTGQGNTATGDGGGLYVAEGSVTLSSTVLVYNNTAVNGAGVHVRGGSLTITGANIGNTGSGEGNVASGNGGGIYVDAWGTLQMSTTEALISGNQASSGAGVYVNGGQMTTTAGSISSNTATTAGGGVYVASGTVTLGSMWTASNTAPDGAGLYVAGGTVTITVGTTGYNTASSSGGGIYVAGGTVAVNGGNLINNTATSGAGLHMAGGAVTLDAATVVRDNSATTGGGLSVAGGTLTATGTTIGGEAGVDNDWNYASTNGGGVYVSGTGALNLTSVTLSDNASGVNGGGLDVTGGTATVTGSTISYGTSAFGGGVCTTGGTTTISNSTIANNSASTSGGGVYAYGGTLTVTGSTIHHNAATLTTGTGGGAGTGGTGTLNLTATAIRNNTAPNGAGVYSGAGTLKVRNSTISTNTATTTGGGVRVDGGTVTFGLTTVTENQAPEGAGLYANAGTTTPTSSIIAGNKTAADTYGGDVKSVAGLTSGGGNIIGVGDVTAFTAQLDRVNITVPGLSTLQGDGTHHLLDTSLAVDGGLCAVGGTTYTTDQLGQPRPGGGGVFCDAGAYELQEVPVACAVKSGETILTGPNARIVQQMVDQVTAGATIKVAGYCGGVAGSDPWTLVIGKSLTIEGGYSTDDDEAWDDPDPVEHPTVLDAQSLGGVVQISGSAGITLRYLTITGGKRSYYAGVLVNAGANATVEYCTITDNHATNWGGGLTNYSGTLTATGNLILGNTAARASGVYNVKGGTPPAVLVMRNNTVTGNVATVTGNYAGGAGLYNTNGEATLQFNTLINNSANWKAENIRLDGGKVTLSANIVVDAPNDVSSCSNNGGTLASGGFNLISATTCLGEAPAGRPDLYGAVVELGELDYNGGPTKNFLPAATVTNPVLDVIPVNACEEILGTIPLDQRKRLRPSLGWETHENWCDPGSVERGKEILAVCGLPLDMEIEGGPRGRCRFDSVAQAMKTAADGDIIVVSGVITENVTLNKDVTLRGPLPDWNTPGTHMGFIQASATPPTSGCTGGTVVSVTAGSIVTIEDLHVRHGCATDGGGIKNEGTLILQRSTVYDNYATIGGGLYNSGTLTVTDSTLAVNVAGSGAGLENESGATATVRRSTVVSNTLSGGAANNLNNFGSLTVGGSILSAEGGTTQCAGTITSEGFNLLNGPACTGLTGATGNPKLGNLRDNGGATLSYAIDSASPAINAGYSDATQCTGQTDQRGRVRPASSICDVGAYEYGPRTLTVDAAALADPAALLFGDLQSALDAAMAGDLIEVRAGVYTGSFTAYRDVSIRHAGVQVSKLSPELGYDLRAILQASTRTPQEQKALGAADLFAGATLTVQGYAPTGSTILPTGDVTVNLQGLTIRHGTGELGGGVHNLGRLAIDGSTIESNAATGETGSGGRGGRIYNAGDLTLARTTVSGNRAEQYGGALYNAGPAADTPVTATLTASTIAYNLALRLPTQHVVSVRSNGLTPAALPIVSGDEIRFETQDSQAHTMEVQPGPAEISCKPSTIEVPRSGLGLSVPLVCTTSAAAPFSGDVIIQDAEFQQTLTVTVSASAATPDGASLFQTGKSSTWLDRSIIYSSGTARPCGRFTDDSQATVLPQGTNLFGNQEAYGDPSATYGLCALLTGDAIREPLLGPLQDNNAIDFAAGAVSGFTHSHALLPHSPAIDALEVTACGAAIAGINLDIVTAGSPGALSMQAGDVVQLTSTEVRTVVFNDGQYSERLVEVPGGQTAVRMQVNQPGTLRYRVYDAGSAEQGYGSITVAARSDRSTDQRGLALPQRGTNQTYRCDIGAYEFAAWVVGQPLPRPPSVSGSNLPQWTINEEDASAYHAWSLAPMLDFAIRPTRPAAGGSPMETAEVTWSLGGLVQSGIVVWPDNPQLHVGSAEVNLAHTAITDGFNVAPGTARAYEGFEPVELVGAIIDGTVFNRSELHAADGDPEEGDSYSVVQLSKSTQSSGSLKVLVIKTLDWDTPGIRDLRDRETADGYNVTDCVIGRELAYPAFNDKSDPAFALPAHTDPEGRSGWILYGEAYDGVRTSAELITAQNTVDNLIPPAHVQEIRDGPILPVLDRAPAEGETDSRTADDLRVAWYQTDYRNVAWPVKSVAYRCRWPVDSQTPKIVIASELGSEIASQAILSTRQFVEPTVYHQVDAEQPGYSPNHEHALLASSNLGNPQPAFYALRTDLHNRNTNDAHWRSYALLKYRDARQDNRTQLAVYRVVLTENPAEIPYAAVPGAIGLTTVDPPGGPTAGTLTLRVGTAILGSNTTATVPVEALNATDLHAAYLEISYDTSRLEPAKCAPNLNRFTERPASPAIEADDNILVGNVVHLRVSTAAGSDLRYKWNFGDGTVQYDDRAVSHVYGSAGTYHITVEVSSGILEGSVSAGVDVHILATQTEAPTLLAPEDPAAHTDCRFSDGKIVLDLITRSKHGLTADSRLADLTFKKKDTFTSGTASIAVSATSDPEGPDYSELTFALGAGLPVYAPTPMRGLLDIQPCAETQANTEDTPFWKDWKGMLWARAAGDMTVKYFYPLQRGFYLSDAYADDHGLLDPETGEVLTEEERIGKCMPWLDNLNVDAYPAGSEVTYQDYSGEEQTGNVYPVGYRVRWPELPALLNVGETVYQRAKSGVSAIGSQVAVTRIYDDIAASQWDNDAGAIAMDPAGVTRSVAQLIDPMAEVSVELPVSVDGNPNVPTDITTQRLLMGGGLALAGNANDPNLALPFALRSRIVFRDTAVDLDGDDEANGTLVFKGYYDGASPEYIKGDPLLLLNVMSLSDKQRLLEICPADSTADGDEDGIMDCQEYAEAIEALYWRTQNPRGLDLCRNADGYLLESDTSPAESVGAPVANISVNCPDYPTYFRDGEADHALLIAVQDTPSLDLYDDEGNPVEEGQESDDVADTPDGIPEPFEGLGKGKALTAGNAAGTGYITVAYNNDSSLGGLPVSLQVIKVQCAKNAAGEESPYRGNLLVIKSDNLFDEKLTLRHTGDFGGQPDNFTFDWWIAPVDDTAVSPVLAPPSYPWQPWTAPEKGAMTLGPQITIEGANPTTLRDNWVIVRYMNNTCGVCGNQYTWSAYAGDPSAKPTELRAQLAEGWIKRVTNALNPFDTRVDDFVSAPTNTTVDMIRQAGPRYEGPVAMNNDPETLNNMGLIEAYQTVLARGRDLSIDAGVNDQGANAALLNVTSRIASLYMLLANDAYMDALDPTVGLGTSSSLGVRAPALFAFGNQFRSDQFGLIDEELALLRGRDETLGGVAAGPTYNRLTWNFTNGDGEVAYVMNYNIKDVNQDGFVNEADAASMYPQGHGDAWGQFLTALTKYYELLRHQNYTWVPRAEPLSVAGAPVVVDYYDERRFATAAAEKARMGAEIVDLTYRKHYADADSQEYVDTHIDASDDGARAWGVLDWAQRAGQGAYFDWVMANAIIPPEDDRYTDLRKIDRTTVLDIVEIANQYAAIEDKLDRADNLANPLGLTGDAVMFDLDPALTKTTPTAEGQTHFEQVYERSLSSLSNALKLYDYANEVKLQQRQAQDQLRDFSLSIMDEDRARVHELIEIFGYPYDADIGVNGTYPEGYDGPDIYNFNLIDRTEITDSEMRCSEQEIAADNCPSETVSYVLEFAPMECLGNYVTTLTGYVYGQPFAVEDVCQSQMPTENLELDYTVGVGLDAGFGRYKPSAWPDDSARKAWGEIQRKMWGVYDAKTEYETAAVAYRNHVEALEQHYLAMKDRAEYLERKNALDAATKGIVLGLDETLKAIDIGKDVYDIIKTSIYDKSWATAMGQPFVVGIDNDMGFMGRLTAMMAGFAFKDAMDTLESQLKLAGTAIEMFKEAYETATQIAMFDFDADMELKSMGYEMNSLLREERTLRLALYLAVDNYYGAFDDYKAEVELGYRKLQDLIRLRKRWAGQIAEQRYSDMAYRIYQNDALLKYRQQFDLAQTYVYLTAAAYDYETNLRGDDPAAGGQFLRNIVATRSLGEIRWTTGPWDVEPIVGSGGLAEPLGKMRDNFVVLKGQMGFNNPQAEANRFSLRYELFRLLDGSDAEWRQTLARYYTPNIYGEPVVAEMAKRPYGTTGPEPGLVIPFGSTITRRLNYFGNPLGPGDSAYSATQFATKIASVGIWFEGYDTARLSQTPRVYLLPGGNDVIRPRNTEGVLRYWNVTEQLLPVPYPITQADMQNPNWIPSINGLQGQFLKVKPYADMRAYPYTEDFEPTELNTDTRLIGRSVWNTEWVLVIPGATLLADPDVGIDRFMQDVDDIYVYFQTYAYAGTAAAAEAELMEDTGDGRLAAGGETPPLRVAGTVSTAADPNAMPQPDALFYGVALRDGAVMESGTLTAILPRGGVVTTEIAPIAGTDYNYALAVPLSYYDAGATPTASDSARIAETISFTVNGIPAVLRDATGISYQAYRIDAAGSGYAVTVDISGPGSYPLGDVNVSGRRDSADALLVLKYDVGLTPGVTTWPPGPGTVYLPLCDVTQDGRCNSTDALRILMCDVALASCPAAAGTAAVEEISLDDAQPAFFRLEQQPDGNEWTVRVVTESPHAPLGVTVLNLTYDPARVKVVSCSENPAGRTDLAACNPAYAEGTVRYTGITTGGIVEAAPLAEVRFEVLDATFAEQLAAGAPLAELAVEAAFDVDLNALRPEVTVPGNDEPAMPKPIYLPLIVNGAPVSTEPASMPEVIPDTPLPPWDLEPIIEPEPAVPVDEPPDDEPVVEPDAVALPTAEPPASEPEPIEPPGEESPGEESPGEESPVDEPPLFQSAPPASESK